MKMFFPLSLMFLLSPIFLSADEGVAQLETLIVPPDFTVGDRVLLRMELIPEAGFWPGEPELPEQEWIVFHESSIREKGESFEILIRFSSFQPGSKTLPPIQCGDVVLDSINITTRSVLEDSEEELEGLRGQVLLPETVFILGFLFTGIIAVPLLIFLLLAWGRKNFSEFKARLTHRRPYKWFCTELDRLCSEDMHYEAADFYYRLSDLSKQYLSDRSGVDFTVYTTREISRPFLEKFSADGPLKKCIALFSRWDQVKYAGRVPKGLNREEECKAAKKWAGELEDSLLGTAQENRGDDISPEDGEA